MTRTSRALKRLGVAGVVAATIGAGVPAFFATSASAAQTVPGTISLSPNQETAEVGGCNPFTVSVPNPGANNNNVVDVYISQTATARDAGGPANTNPAVTIGFCTPNNTQASNVYTPGTVINNPPNTDPGATNVTGVNGGNNLTTTNGGNSGTTASECAGSRPGNTNAAATPPGNNNTAGAAACDGKFFLNNGDSSFTFGVYSNYAGTMPVVAYYDSNGNFYPDNFENNRDTSTKYWVANANTGAQAGDITCTPTAASNPVGTYHRVLCTVTAQNGSTVSGAEVNFTVTSGPNAGKTSQNSQDGNCGQYQPNPAANPPAPYNGNTAPANTQVVGNPPGTPGYTDENGQIVCEYQDSNGAGKDTIVLYSGQNAAQGQKTSTVTKTWVGAPRSITCTPKSDTQTVGAFVNVVCTVGDVKASPVPNTVVRFTSTGVGHFSDGSTTAYRTTDSNGQVTVTATTFTNDPRDVGDQTITAAIVFDNGNNTCNAAGGYQGCQTAAQTTPNAANDQQCEQAAGAGTGATANTPQGNCSDSVVIHWIAAGNQSSPPASSTPPSGRKGLTLVVNTPTINAGGAATLTATGQAGQQYQLQCYTRPSTTYFTARQGTFNSVGDPVEFTLNLGRNTRCFIQYATAPAQASPSVVVNVRTVLSLSTVRNGVRDYTFRGTNLPRVGGQLITLYRIANGSKIRTAIVYTDATGTWHIRRVFTGRGTFQFQVSTTQTLNNAAGSSNVITVTIR